MASEKGYRDVVQTLLGAVTDVNITRSDVSNFRSHTEELVFLFW